MADAKIRLPDGATVDVKGTPEEVARILSLLGPGGAGVGDNQKRRETTAKSGAAKPETDSNAKRSAGEFPANTLKAYVMELKFNGFFKGQKRTLGDVKEALAGMGHIYPDSSIGGRLLELVKARLLGRVRIDGTWHYVHRN